MSCYSSSDKARLAEFSYKVYERFLQRVYKDVSINISERNLILLYCFLHRGISYNQLTTLFGNTLSKKKALYMVVKRLKDSGYIEFLKINKSSKRQQGDMHDNTFVITSAGASQCKKLLLELFPKYMSETSFTEQGFGLDDVLSYLERRCMVDIPGYWTHYLAARDINIYLLSSPKVNYDVFSYETEVGISEYGVPLTIYSRKLIGFSRKDYPIRCDALLSYMLRQSNDNYEFKFFIEQDNSTQSSILINEKVSNYSRYYLESSSFSPMCSLVFCLNTHIDNKNKELGEVKGYSTKDFYYRFALECAWDLLCLDNNNYSRYETVSDVFAFLKEKKDAGILTSSLLLLYDYLASLSDLNIPISSFKQKYYESRDVMLEKQAEVITAMHRKKYFKRRALIFRNLADIDTLPGFFIKGFSLFTVNNNDIDNSFPYLIPELFQFKSRLRKMFSSLNMVSNSSIPAYEPFYTVSDDGFMLRNSYKFDEGLHVIIENISDDLGGQYRIKHLLNHSSLPSALASTKLLCLFDDDSIDMVKELYLNSNLGRFLSKRSGSRISMDGFEVIFASYDTIRLSGSLFTFNAEGNKVYKYN